MSAYKVLMINIIDKSNTIIIPSKLIFSDGVIEKELEFKSTDTVIYVNMCVNMGLYQKKGYI